MSSDRTPERALPSVAARSVARRKATDLAVKIVSWVAASIGIAAMGLIVCRSSCGGAARPQLGLLHQATPPDPDGHGGGLGQRHRGHARDHGFAAALMGIPLGFFAGVYLAEFGRDGRVATAMRADRQRHDGRAVHHRRRVRLRACWSSRSVTTPASPARSALAFIMLPVMARTAEDILNLVPNELRESALAHGRAALEGRRWASSAGPPRRPDHRRDAGRRARRRRDGAPALHGAQQPVLAAGLFGPDGFFGGPTANLTKTIYDFAASPYHELDPAGLGRGARHHHRRAGNEHPRAAGLPARQGMVGTTVDESTESGRQSRRRARRSHRAAAPRGRGGTSRRRRGSTPSRARSRCGASTSSTARSRRSSTTTSRSREPGDGRHRPVGLRQVDAHPRLQPHLRAVPRPAGQGRDHAGRQEHARRPDRRARAAQARSA